MVGFWSRLILWSDFKNVQFFRNLSRQRKRCGIYFSDFTESANAPIQNQALNQKSELCPENFYKIVMKSCFLFFEGGGEIFIIYCRL